MDKSLIIEELYKSNSLDYDKLLYLIKNIDKKDKEILFENSNKLRLSNYSNRVYLRGLLEISNYCSNACIYCGINRNNKNIKRYRLSREEIIESCLRAYDLGYRTFVLQGGEDSYYKDELVEDILYSLKSQLDDIRITLSLGEKSYKTYKRYFDAGADRYLLRHESADKELFKKIHIDSSFEERANCLFMLKDIGYQIGAGFMVGIPGQKEESLAKDLVFLKELEAEMVGIGPFIPHKDTAYKDEKAGSLEMTLLMISLVRNLLPEALIPATTALNTLGREGRDRALKLGANVLMPNISPVYARENYELYDNKIYLGSESGEEVKKISLELEELKLKLDMSKGDHKRWWRK